MARGVIPWAGVCIWCRRAIQSPDPGDGFAWEDADGRSECVNTTSRHEPEVPTAYTSVTADDWVETK